MVGILGYISNSVNVEVLDALFFIDSAILLTWVAPVLSVIRMESGRLYR